MDAKTFFDNFETIANAPGGISRLRELILDLAVRGKLTEQISDEIRLEVPEIDGLFEIPNNWAWCALEKIADYGGRGNVSPNEIVDSDWVLDLEDIEKTTSRLLDRVRSKDRKTTSSKGRFDIGDVLYGKLRPYLDKVLVADAPGYCTTEIIPITPKFDIDPQWLRISLKSPMFIEYVTEKSYGMKMPRLGTKDAKASLHAVPPIEEQKRIVAKVDELMALCDELESAQDKRNSIRAAARKSGIDAISTATTAEELDIAWKRIRDNWLTIADTPESIASLRSLILGMAVRGKLVDQRESEGVGSEFVSQFSGSYKPLTAPKKMPFEIPEAWVWSYLGNVSINRDYERVPISKPERETRQGPYDYYGASGVIDSYDEFLFDKPLLLIGEDGANLVNRSTPIAFMARGKYWVNNHAHVLDSTSEHALEYLAIVINQMDLKPFLTGTAQPKLNQAKLNGLQIPVPPFDEQKRIVAKVEELMALCGELERCMAERNRLAKKIAGSLASEIAA
jgi:type I restriction enzyme S subunit